VARFAGLSRAFCGPCGLWGLCVLQDSRLILDDAADRHAVVARLPAEHRRDECAQQRREHQPIM
jgi:hypothetical protein